MRGSLSRCPWRPFPSGWNGSSIASIRPGATCRSRETGRQAGTAPAGLRVLEAVLAREFGADRVAVCYPDQLHEFIGEATRVVSVSTHNPLGTASAAGVYASTFGSSREPINALYARWMFNALRRAWEALLALFRDTLG